MGDKDDVCLHYSILATVEGRRKWIASWSSPLEMMRQSMTYFTMWAGTITILSEIFNLYRYERIARICWFMNLHAFLGGSYICHVYPRQLRVSYARLFIEGYPLMIADMLTHTLPFAHVTSRMIVSSHRMYFKDILDVSPLMLYLFLFDANEKYGLGVRDILRLVVIFILLMTAIHAIY